MALLGFIKVYTDEKKAKTNHPSFKHNSLVSLRNHTNVFSQG